MATSVKISPKNSKSLSAPPFPKNPQKGGDKRLVKNLSKGLGKGLGSLLHAQAASATPLASPEPMVEKGERVVEVPLDLIIPSPLQPRKEFRPEQLADLVESIRHRGIIQPLIVRQVGHQYELIAGERRLRASCTIGLQKAPVIIRVATDHEVVELALIENLQREGLNPIEEAEAYHRLAEEFGITQEEVAKRVGKSRTAITNALRLLDLTPEVRTLLLGEHLSVGHAKVLLGVKTAEEQLYLAKEIIRRHASVRLAERLVREYLLPRSTKTRAKKRLSGVSSLSPGLQHLQNQLQQHLATRVTLQHGEKKGQLIIEYYGEDDLDRLLSEIGLKLP